MIEPSEADKILESFARESLEALLPSVLYEVPEDGTVVVVRIPDGPTSFEASKESDRRLIVLILDAERLSLFDHHNANHDDQMMADILSDGLDNSIKNPVVVYSFGSNRAPGAFVDRALGVAGVEVLTNIALSVKKTAEAFEAMHEIYQSGDESARSRAKGQIVDILAASGLLLQAVLNRQRTRY